jgi:hypothetical protein
MQMPFVWPASMYVVRSYVDQLVRGKGLAAEELAALTRDLDAAERRTGAARKSLLTRLATRLDAAVKTARDAERVRAVAAAIRKLAA